MGIFLKIINIKMEYHYYNYNYNYNNNYCTDLTFSGCPNGTYSNDVFNCCNYHASVIITWVCVGVGLVFAFIFFICWYKKQQRRKAMEMNIEAAYEENTFNNNP